MKRFLLITGLAALCLTPQATHAQQSAPALPKVDFSMNKYGDLLIAPRYKEQVQKILKNQRTGFDFSLFRVYYSKTRLYDPIGEDARNRLLEKAYIATNAESEPERELALRDYFAILYAHFANIDVVAQAASLARDHDQLGDAEQLQWLAHGLIKSVAGSGDGKSLDDPYTVLMLSEEKFLLKHLRTVSVKTEEISHANSHYRIHTVITGPNGETSSLFVDATKPISYLNHRRADGFEAGKIPAQN